MQRLKAIVQKLLLLARADAGTLAPDFQPVNLSEIAGGLCDDIRDMAPRLELRREIAGGIRVMADEGLLRQLLHNLADNAVKYNTGDGWIRCRLEQAPDAVRLTLANTGRPIPPEERGKIFDRFHRGDAAHNRTVDGVGLGLSLAREIARAHGGELVLDDASDGVVSFILTLPAAPPSPRGS